MQEEQPVPAIPPWKNSQCWLFPRMLEGLQGVLYHWGRNGQCQLFPQGLGNSRHRMFLMGNGR